jgi:hypothetical protein
MRGCWTARGTRRLGQEVPSLLLDSCDRVGSGREAQRLLVLTCELDQCVGELGGVTSLPGTDLTSAKICRTGADAVARAADS